MINSCHRSPLFMTACRRSCIEGTTPGGSALSLTPRDALQPVPSELLRLGPQHSSACGRRTRNSCEGRLSAGGVA
jgi:hypothetical protein